MARKLTINKKYTHFCISKKTGKIVDAWEYPVLYEYSDIKEYYEMDMKDNDRNTKEYNLVRAYTLLKKNINPFDTANWGNN